MYVACYIAFIQFTNNLIDNITSVLWFDKWSFRKYIGFTMVVPWFKLVILDFLCLFQLARFYFSSLFLSSCSSFYLFDAQQNSFFFSHLEMQFLYSVDALTSWHANRLETKLLPMHGCSALVARRSSLRIIGFPIQSAYYLWNRRWTIDLSNAPTQPYPIRMTSTLIHCKQIMNTEPICINR